jgi:hypothetical protein
MLGLVVEELSEELFTELMQGFPAPWDSGVEAPVGKELEVPTGAGAPGGQGAGDARDILGDVCVGLFVGGLGGGMLVAVIGEGIRAFKGEELGRWLGGEVGPKVREVGGEVVGALVGGGIGALLGAFFGTDVGGDVGARREAFPTLGGGKGVVASVREGVIILVAASLAPVVFRVLGTVAGRLIVLLIDALLAIRRT